MGALPLAPLVVLVLVASFDARADAESDMRAWCAAKWVNDYSMQDYCFTKQAEAAVELQPILRSTHPVEKKIIQQCLAKWKEGPTFDFSMVLYCYNQQIDAWNRINR